MSPNLKGLRCLVMGGSGFIGSNICRGLLASGARVRAFSRNPPVANGREWHADVEWTHGNFCDPEFVRRSLKDIDVAYHLISSTLPATSNLDVPLDLTTNVISTLQMLEIAKNSGLRK